MTLEKHDIFQRKNLEEEEGESIQIFENLTTLK